MPLADRLIPDGEESSTLDTLLARVGPAMLHPLGEGHGSGAGGAAVVARIVLHDPSDPLPDVAQALLLVPAARVDDDLEALLAHAAERGCPGVAVKVRGLDVEAAVERAARHGVVLLAVDDAAAWQHVVSVLESALGSSAVDGTRSAPDTLFALANAAAAGIGGAVAIEDLDRSVVAYSVIEGHLLDRLREEGILGRRVPDVAHNIERYRALFAAAGVVHFPEVDDALARTALAVTAGTRALGSIWVIDPPGGVSEAGERTLREAASLAALHMLRRRTNDEVRLHLRADVVGGALEGRWSDRETQRRLALSPGARPGLVGFAASRVGAEWLTILPYLSHALSRFVATFRPDAGLVDTPSAVYVLVPDGGEKAALRLAQQGVAALARSFRDQVRAGVAGAIDGVADLVAARREIDEILRELSSDPELPRVGRLDDVRERVLLQRVRDEFAADARLLSPGILALLDNDEQQGTDYRRTLLVWFEEHGDVRAAAARLGVHPNTLRYRVRRAAEQFALPLEDPASRLALWLQLRTFELQK
ncbi:PucR family transcriptional regulator [Microbacterium sp. Leaf179]|uniref:PucR family transcriptional regulator n=1 Tax=unclassified Microbacterium TaxID=2609290 RepID=UPI000B22FD9B|nr:PucR family transcriptional regulator [Microbacterium sp. Leaf179]